MQKREILNSILVYLNLQTFDVYWLNIFNEFSEFPFFKNRSQFFEQFFYISQKMGREIGTTGKFLGTEDKLISDEIKIMEFESLKILHWIDSEISSIEAAKSSSSFSSPIDDESTSGVTFCANGCLFTTCQESRLVDEKVTLQMAHL